MSDLQVLNEVVKHAKAFWIFTVLDVNQRANFGSLARDAQNDEFLAMANRCEFVTHLESDVVVADTNFKLLLSNNVLFRPVRVVFSDVGDKIVSQRRHLSAGGEWLLLCDLTRFHNAFELLHDERSNPH